jgi:hypothetical protein
MTENAGRSETDWPNEALTAYGFLNEAVALLEECEEIVVGAPSEGAKIDFARAARLRSQIAALKKRIAEKVRPHP